MQSSTKNSIEFTLNYKKIVQAILYVINKSDGSINKYNLMKIMFASDKYHMLKYIRPVTGDKYIRMQHGTVPSKMLDMVNGKNIKTCLKELGEESLPFQLSATEKDIVMSSAKENRKLLSKSDIEALNHGIKEYGNLSFSEARIKNHNEKCWQNAQPNKQIPFESIAADNPESIEYLQACSRTLVL